MRRWLLSVATLVALFFALAFPTVVPAAPPTPKPQPQPAAKPAAAVPQDHPEIRDAIESLRHAREHLNHAAHDYHGHRADAIGAIDAAIRQLEICMKFDTTGCLRHAGFACWVRGLGPACGACPSQRAPRAG